MSMIICTVLIILECTILIIMHFYFPPTYLLHLAGGGIIGFKKE